MIDSLLYERKGNNQCLFKFNQNLKPQCSAAETNMSANKTNDSDDLVLYHCILKTGEVTFTVSPSTCMMYLSINYIAQKGANYG